MKNIKNLLVIAIAFFALQACEYKGATLQDINSSNARQTTAINENTNEAVSAGTAKVIAADSVNAADLKAAMAKVSATLIQKVDSALTDKLDGLDHWAEEGKKKAAEQNRLDGLLSELNYAFSDTAAIGWDSARTKYAEVITPAHFENRLEFYKKMTPLMKAGDSLSLVILDSIANDYENVFFGLPKKSELKGKAAIFQADASSAAAKSAKAEIKRLKATIEQQEAALAAEGSDDAKLRAELLKKDVALEAAANEAAILKANFEAIQRALRAEQAKTSKDKKAEEKAVKKARRKAGNA